MIVMFPEGWPNIDPPWTPKVGFDDMLAFEPGFVRLAALAERGGHPPVAIVPAGLHYAADGSRSVTLRFGKALLRTLRAHDNFCDWLINVWWNCRKHRSENRIHKQVLPSRSP